MQTIVLSLIPLSHRGPVHPVSQPVSHRPVTWLQITPSLQCPIHFWVQFTPNQPSLHSIYIKKPNYFMKRLQFIVIYLVLSFTFLRVLIDLITCVDLTWNTCFTNPPRNTSKTGSKMYVTIFVFTAYRTGDATVTAIHARALTTF